MMKNLVLSIFVIFMLTGIAKGQIGGISGSKLAAYCVDVVDHKRLEVEPGLYRFNANSAWITDGSLQSIYASPDSLETYSGMYLRLTYGLWDKLEFGANISSDLVASNWGARYILFNKEKIGLATIAGINFPLVLKARNKNLDLDNADYSFGGGLVSTYSFTDNLSLDITAQYVMPFNTENWTEMSGQIINLDLGLYVHNRMIQLIGGIGYSRFVTGNEISEILSVCHGVTIETDRFIIVACLPTDIYGINALKTNGVMLALTLTF